MKYNYHLSLNKIPEKNFLVIVTENSGGVLLSLFLSSASKQSTTKIQGSQKESKLNVIYQFLIFADDVNLLDQNLTYNQHKTRKLLRVVRRSVQIQYKEK
jgi:hypothetical protein